MCLIDMFICMRTTLNLDDALMLAVKSKAAETGRTMTAVVEEALREFLRRPEATEPYRLEWRPVSGRALPGVDVNDRDALYERMEGRG